MLPITLLNHIQRHCLFVLLFLCLLDEQWRDSKVLNLFLTCLLLLLLHILTDTMSCCYCFHTQNVVHYTHTMSCCYCFHTQNVVHYIHAMSCCYCFYYKTLYITYMPCYIATVSTTKCCTLYTYHVLLLLFPLQNVVHYTHTMLYCYCFHT